MAVKGEAMVLPVYAIREDRGLPNQVRQAGRCPFLRPREQAAIQGLSDFMQAWVTSVVRRYPDQWFWLHSRWIKRSTMRKILERGLDFREFVLSHAPRTRGKMNCDPGSP
ncbi:MAG: hypothetical protein MZU95_14220 [Desulfomicrobium escambiense]|nr:hypothetical protein [Desulfomicrobium escambiense]